MPYRTSTIDFIVDNCMNFLLPVDLSPKKGPNFSLPGAKLENS